jgi:Lipid A 3-O-deacylase (PagL)
MSLIPLGNSPGVKVAIVTAILLFLSAFFVKSCRGDELHMDYLAGSAVVRGPAGAMGMLVCDERKIAGFADVCGGFYLIGDSNWNGYNSYQAVVHAQVVSRLKYGFELGIGVAKIQHSDAYNSGAINFSLSLEHQIYKNLYLRYQHFSNAGTNIPNTGRDLLFAAWRF